MPVIESLVPAPSVTLTTTTLTISVTAVNPDIPTTPSLPSPTEINGDYQVPRLIVPIDLVVPDRVIGNSYSADISPSKSTLFNFYIPLTYTGKACALSFYIPPDDPDVWTPYEIYALGGASVHQLYLRVNENTTAQNVGGEAIAGIVPEIRAGMRHVIWDGPCPLGQELGYRVDSVGGLDMRFFQLEKPPLGLFIVAS